MVGAKSDKATIHRDMVSMEQDQAANNEVGGIQWRRKPLKQLTDSGANR